MKIVRDADKNNMNEGFEAVYAKHKGLIYYIINRGVNNSADADDLLQEIWLRVLKSMNKLAQLDEKQTKNYIAAIATNKVKDYQRDLAKEREIFDLNDSLVDEAKTQALEKEIFGDRFQDVVRVAIKKLSLGYRNIILMKYVYDMSIREIGDDLSISEEAAGMKVYRALKSLKKILEAEGINSTKDMYEKGGKK